MRLGRVSRIPAVSDQVARLHALARSHAHAAAPEMRCQTVQAWLMLDDDEVSQRAPGEGIDDADLGVVTLPVADGDDDPIGRRDDRPFPSVVLLGPPGASRCGAPSTIRHDQIVGVALSPE